MGSDQQTGQLIDVLFKNESWYSKLPMELTFLIKATLLKGFTEKRLKAPENGKLTWQELIKVIDTQTLYHLILSLGPETFRSSLDLTTMPDGILSILKTVESATCDRTLQMLLETIESHESIKVDEFPSKLASLF